MSAIAQNPHWNFPPPTYDTHSYMSTTSLTPYLQLPHLLSLTWLAYPILSIGFVAFRLQLSLAASQDAVANAKGNLMTSCKAAEQAATAAASMPRYMAIVTNQQFADAVNGSMNGARAALVLSLTAMEGIINFIIDIYRSTLLCFMELVIRGGLAIIIGAVQELNNLVQNVTSALRTSIQNDISSANSAIKSAIDAVNKVNPFGNINVPQITVPSLDALANVTLPPTFQDTLTNLNNTLPSFDDLKQKIDVIIDTPFELLKKDINDTFSGLSFNSSALPVPQQNFVTFCNNLDMTVVDDIGHDLIRIAKIGTIILIFLALVLTGLNCLLEWYKWRCLKRHLEYTRQAWMTDPTLYHSRSPAGAPQLTLSDHNLLMLHANSSHPLLTRIANTMSARLRLSPSQHTHLQWFFHYILHPPALACLLIGLIGLLSVQIQLFAMDPLVNKYSDRAASTVSDFSNLIATSINASMYNQSTVYAGEVNGRVAAVQTTINSGVFGWVNGTTTTLNSTIVEFYDDIQNAVSTIFNGTILEQPARDFIRCLIGTKVDVIENALTFMHDNLKIDMPRVNDTVLVLSQESVDEATRPIAAAAIGGGANDDQGLIGRLVNSYADSLRKERLMFGIFIALWCLVVFMGFCVLFWHSYGKKWVQGRKRHRWEREQRSGIDGLIIPFKVPTQTSDQKCRNGGSLAHDLPSFTPLPSPRGSAFKPISFNRAASPVTNKFNPPRSAESEERSWDSFFGENAQPKQVAPPSWKPAKLIAIGRKALNKERFVDDREKIKNEPPVTNNDPNDQHNRNAPWFSRVAMMLGKKPAEPESFPNDPQSFRQHARPNLRIEIDRASSIRDKSSGSEDVSSKNGTRVPSSRWSASPDASKTAVSWTNLISPTKTAPYPPIEFSIRPKPRHTNVPSDVGSSYESSSVAPLNHTPLAMPLYHGFDSTRQFGRDPYESSHSPLKSPRAFRHQNSLAPPPDRHRRTSSVPVTKTTTTDMSGTSVTPVTRLLTSTHARRSSSVDPFVTPFDDEHRVTIAHPNHIRRSIPTNPFTALAL